MADIALPSFSPLHPRSRSLAWQLAALLLGTALLTASSWIRVPMLPVPMTMQTFAVTLIGALYGWRLGAATVMAWLLQGATGLPVFAGGAGGAMHLVGATGGYLIAFPVAAALTGWLAEKGWNGRRPLLALVSMLAGNALCLVIGTAWLANFIGLEKAIAVGALPFLLGAVVKSALAAATLRALPRS